MDSFFHRIKVFVFHQVEDDLEYLILRQVPRHETLWGPVEGPILPSENLELAACRRVRDLVGIEKPVHLIDLRMPERWSLPREQVVEWAFGYRAESAGELHRVSRNVTDYRWDDFEMAFRAMELSNNRDAILRLHLMLTTGG